MTRFETDKAAQLKRLIVLRISNAIGMVGWRENQFACAEPKFRMIHPFNWVIIPMLILASVLLQGIPETIRETKRLFARDAVWW